MKRLFTLSLCLIIGCIHLTACGRTSTNESTQSNQIQKETFVFSIKGTDTLRLDKYDIPELTTGAKPCVIFVFGGGFAQGERDHEYNSNYMIELAKRGYVAVAIDYRLGFKNLSGQQPVDAAGFSSMLTSTILLAVEDLYDATSYVYSNAGAWNIDRDKIVANGSSAGAITVLQGEYLICNRMEALTQKLPQGFRYGGIIAFAGAIASPSLELNWPIKPSPLMLFHGDADRNVPFGRLTVGQEGFFGSDYIATQLSGMEVPYYYYKAVNYDHEIAGSPMSANLDEINSFIQKYVVARQPLVINTEVKAIGRPDLEKDFTIQDYIQMNYQ